MSYSESHMIRSYFDSVPVCDGQTDGHAAHSSDAQNSYSYRPATFRQTGNE